MLRYLIVFSLLFFVAGCGSGGKKQAKKKKQKISATRLSYGTNVKAIVSIQTFDHYSRQLKSGYGFYVANDIIVTNLDLIKGCYKAKTAHMNTDDFNNVRGFVGYSFNYNLVFLKTRVKNLNYLKLRNAEENTDSIYSLFRKNRKLFIHKSGLKQIIDRDTVSFYPVTNKSMSRGKPAFALNHRLFGILQKRKTNNQSELTVLPAKWISDMLKKVKKEPESLIHLSRRTDKVYPSYKKIKGFRIITDMGNIDIKLFNETPVYRDNFIKLVSDHFYDSLLVHRVIRDFLIQTGAADTKYAKKDDVVGWQGPGYTLPMNIRPGLFHRRGAIAASKLPEDRNPRNRSDGSQFYIVSGRIFTDDELNEIEKEKHIKFTPEQRKVYTTVGGAPHLDGDYTVFGEVTKGMDVVDKIASVKTYAVDRPVKDIRVKTIRIIWK
ncbi:MAG: peptidylprolyl isomerase [Chlorobi bacterium]|nr:peptidylprolyl isomerase [Chlorobiota bacterium]